MLAKMSVPAQLPCRGQIPCVGLMQRAHRVPVHSGTPRSTSVHSRGQRRMHATRHPPPRGIPVTGPGGSYSEDPPSIDPDKAAISLETIATMKEKISEALETEDVVVNDAYGDARHVAIEVVSNAFEGLSSVQRQRLVYKAIWLELQSTVHAVDSMTTKTPSEEAKQA